MLLSLQGNEGTGKSTLAYSAPYPIIGLQFDLGADRALYGGRWELFKDQDIKIVEWGDKLDPKESHDITVYNLPRAIQIGDTLVGVREQWKEAQRLVVGIAGSGVKSLVIDTATLARKHAADAYLQELQEKSTARKQLIQIEWAHPNQEIADIYSLFKGMGKNLITVHHLTDERLPMPNKDGIVENTPTGKRIAEGYSKTPQLVDVIIETSIGTVSKLVDGKIVQSEGVIGTFKKCGYNLSLVGTRIENPTWDSIVDAINLSTGNRLSLPRREVIATTK